MSLTIPEFMNNFRYLILFSFLFILFFKSNYGQGEQYAKVKVKLTSEKGMPYLNTLAIDFDHFQIFDESSIAFIVNWDDLKTET